MTDLRRKILHILGPLFGAALFALAVGVLHHELRKYGFHQIVQSVSAIPYERIALGIAFTALCYLALTFYDTLALRYLKNPLPYRRIAKASFVGYAFSHNVGLSLITSAPMKYRIYSAWGIGAVDVVKVVAFCGLTFWTGFATLAGIALIAEPRHIPEVLNLPAIDGRIVSIILFGLVVTYLILSTRGHSVRIGKHELFIPSTRFALGQILAGCMEWLSASAVLYCLFFPTLPISYPMFLCLFLFAYVSGFVSQVPGGLGVFESLILLALKDYASAPTIMGALLAYRAIYYILPLLIAIVILGAHEWSHRKWEKKVGIAPPR